MKRIISLLLCVPMLLGLFSCTPALVDVTEETSEETTTGAGLIVGGTTETEEVVDTYDYPEIKKQLNWASINSFPIKSSTMTTDELRKLCVDFFRFAKTALWVADEDLDFIRNSSGTKDSMDKGTVYGGLPYVGLGSGNIYRLMDYMNEETGVVDLSEAAKIIKLFGNQCSIGAYWGWGRVINSANYDWTQNMIASRGFIPVGPYQYDGTKSFTTKNTTTDIIAQNGSQVMYQSYAQMKLGDGMVYYTTAGHVIMCSSNPVVVYNADGTINGNESYTTIIDQGQKWIDGKNDQGDSFRYKGSVDSKKTFAQLASGSYLPFTFAEFLGTDPVEETVCTFSHTGDQITVQQLTDSSVTANYGISDIYAIIKDASGKEVYRRVVRASQANVRELVFKGTVHLTGIRPYADGSNTIEIIAQLSTGERPTLYTGILVL